MTDLRDRIIELAERAMRSMGGVPGPAGDGEDYPMIAELKAMARTKTRTIKGSTPESSQAGH